MIDLTELQAEVHALAHLKGWYDDRDLTDPDVRAAMLCLIHSEVSEALECVRRGEMALRYEVYDFYVGRHIHLDTRYGVTNKPVGFPSELADVVIRCLDYLEAFEDYSPTVGASRCRQDVSKPTGVAAALHHIHCEIFDHMYAFAVDYCFGLANALGFDLLEVIKIKHEYNKTRPNRHGGKAL